MDTVMNATCLKLVKGPAYWTERYLETWANLESVGGGPDGYASKTRGLEGYTSYDADSESAQRKLDIWIAEHVGEVVMALPLAQRCAIERAYGLASVFRFPRGYLETLAEAKVNVQAGLRRRGVWLGE